MVQGKAPTPAAPKVSSGDISVERVKALKELILETFDKAAEKGMGVSSITAEFELVGTDTTICPKVEVFFK